MLTARSLILALYDDYLFRKSNEVSIAGMVKTLTLFGFSDCAVRSAVSRMYRSGLLKARRDSQGSHYSLTDKAHKVLREHTDLSCQHPGDNWDGIWSIVTYSIPENLYKVRRELRLGLAWLGYGTLSEATWISPRDLTQPVKDLTQSLGIKEYVYYFHVRLDKAVSPEIILTRCWNLPRINRKYAFFIDQFRPKLSGYIGIDTETIEPKKCLIELLNLIYEFRRLPPGPDLPRELLPEDWLRPEAETLFHEFRELLVQRVDEYSSEVFKTNGHNGLVIEK
jgi:phenylacetic acid degradation operon negative regulatory protein